MVKHEIDQLVFKYQMKRFVQSQPIITSPQPFSPTRLPQNNLLVSQHAEGFHSPGFPHRSDSEKNNESFQYMNMMK